MNRVVSPEYFCTLVLCTFGGENERKAVCSFCLGSSIDPIAVDILLFIYRYIKNSGIRKVFHVFFVVLLVCSICLYYLPCFS